jgi:hypothetical protein
MLTRDDLDSRMEWDSFYRIVNGELIRVDEYPCPSVYWISETSSIDGKSHVEIDGTAPDGYTMTLLNGFSGQYSYNGPVMHPSEYVGGGLASFMLENMSSEGCLYAITEIVDIDDLYSCPEGWAIVELVPLP